MAGARGSDRAEMADHHGEVALVGDRAQGLHEVIQIGRVGRLQDVGVDALDGEDEAHLPGDVAVLRCGEDAVHRVGVGAVGYAVGARHVEELMLDGDVGEDGVDAAQHVDVAGGGVAVAAAVGGGGCATAAGLGDGRLGGESGVEFFGGERGGGGSVTYLGFRRGARGGDGLSDLGVHQSLLTHTLSGRQTGGDRCRPWRPVVQALCAVLQKSRPPPIVIHRFSASALRSQPPQGRIPTAVVTRATASPSPISVPSRAKPGMRT